MDTLITTPSAFNLREPIPGYSLRERIGSGGYGEVWLADALGGLTKAVKIVYGPLRDGRAERELKALNRIKLVQHPLLLTLERIEMIDEHLVIVMELAHGSLKDRFEKYSSNGERGIPRPELLAYLRDVADALDFLYEEHSLQHLDVKPENLLLIANRVKVADFGLIKDLGDRSASLVGGLTPLYAPPEVFDGRPNRNSDQYSLAMVYQELLTGEPAFAGRTAAQLAAQHLHSNPCLTPLPTSDQPVIARALSKDPDRRFPSCRALIDSLTEAPKVATRVRRAVAESCRITPTPPAPAALPGVAGKPSDELVYPVHNEVRNLPAWDIDPESGTTCRPAVFIGVGSTGAHVLRSLRARLGERFGNVDAIPSLQMLLLDTDTAALNEATRGDRASALRPNQLVPLALRPPQEYRGDAKNLLEWLNRRWLFNIPRSLTTEGIRPLGRLALVDHFEKVANVLHHALSSVVTDASLASSSRATGLRFSKHPPRIFVVASIAGGVGSGLVLDLGYLLRTILDELRMSDEQLHGLLVHSTSRRTNQRDLAIANSLSLLTELYHYRSSQGYPGEPACKLPPRVGDSAPFRHTYVTHLGDELNDEQFAQRATDLGEYLYQSTVSAASSFFDRCRQDDNHSTRSVPSSADTVANGTACTTTMPLADACGSSRIAPTSVPPTDLDAPHVVRTFGIAHIGGAKVEIARQEADALCETLVSRWAGRRLVKKPTGSGTPPIDPEVVNVARKFSNGMGLRFDKLVIWAQRLIEQQLGDRPEAYFEPRVMAALEHAAGQEPAERVELAARLVREELHGGDQPADSIASRVRDQVATVAAMKRQMLREWFFVLLDAPKARVSGTRDSMRWYQELLAELEAKAHHAITLLDGAAEATAAKEMCEHVRQRALTDFQRLALHAVLQLVSELQTEVRLCEDYLHEFARRMLHLVNEFATARPSSREDDNRLARLLKESHAELTRQLDRDLTPILVHKHLALSDLLTADSDAWSTLVATMRTSAYRLASNVIGRLQVSSVIQGLDEPIGNAPTNPAECVHAALPRLAACGGDRRFVIVAPQSACGWHEDWIQPFEAAAGAAASRTCGTDESLVVGCEMSRVPLRNVAAQLVGARTDLVKVANRLHTRIDVEWPALEQWLYRRD